MRKTAVESRWYLLVLVLLSLPCFGETKSEAVKWPLPAIPPGATVYPDLPYVSNGSPSQKLDLYLPKEGKNLPLIIYVHGGAFYMGDKRKWIRYDLGYLSQGYAMASINYRLSDEAVFPAQIEDCKAAMRWLRAHAAEYRLDPNRFAVWGASAGGNLAAMLGTTENTSAFDVGENLSFSSRVQAVADFFGPTDLLQLPLTSMGPDSALARFAGCAAKYDLTKVRRASPISYVNKDSAPFLIVHGTADPIVPYLQSVLMTAALKKLGVPVTFYTVKGERHGGFHDPEVPQLTSDFFAKYLKPGDNSEVRLSERAHPSPSIAPRVPSST